MRLLYVVAASIRYICMVIYYAVEKLIKSAGSNTNVSNFVDERIELVSLVFRLAGKKRA